MMKFNTTFYENLIKEYVSSENFIADNVKLIRHNDFTVVWFLLTNINTQVLISVYERDLISPKQLLQAFKTQFDIHYTLKGRVCVI